jgi:hypothetical protein
MNTIQNRETKKEMIQDLIIRVKDRAINIDPISWPITSVFHEFGYTRKNGVDRSKILFVASGFTFTENNEYCYFFQRKQACNNYYLKVMRVKDLAYDLVDYCSDKKDTVESLRYLKNMDCFNDPYEVKRRIYSGSGKGELNLFPL